LNAFFPSFDANKTSRVLNEMSFNKTILRFYKMLLRFGKNILWRCILFTACLPVKNALLLQKYASVKIFYAAVFSFR
jgi:hypothetical protein